MQSCSQQRAASVQPGKHPVVDLWLECVDAGAFSQAYSLPSLLMVQLQLRTSPAPAPEHRPREPQAAPAPAALPGGLQTLPQLCVGGRRMALPGHAPRLHCKRAPQEAQLHGAAYRFRLPPRNCHHSAAASCASILTVWGWPGLLQCLCSCAPLHPAAPPLPPCLQLGRPGGAARRRGGGRGPAPLAGRAAQLCAAGGSHQAAGGGPAGAGAQVGCMGCMVRCRVTGVSRGRLQALGGWLGGAGWAGGGCSCGEMHARLRLARVE